MKLQLLCYRRMNAPWGYLRPLPKRVARYLPPRRLGRTEPKLYRSAVPMSVMPSPAKYFPSKWKIPYLLIVAFVSCVSAAWGQAPTVVIDAQQNIGPPNGDPTYGYPQSIAVAGNGTVYIADTNNNRVIGLITNLP